MDKLCIFTGTFVLGYLFWFLGERSGLELLGCFLLSGFGSMLGVYLGWKVAQRFK